MPAEAVAVVKTALDAAAAARGGDVGIDLFSVRIQKCTSSQHTWTHVNTRQKIIAVCKPDTLAAFQ